MADVLYLLLIAIFFALAAGFVRLCEAIIGSEVSAPVEADPAAGSEPKAA